MDEIVPSKLKPLSLVFAQNNKITSTAIKAENIFLFFRTLFVQRSPLVELLLRCLKIMCRNLIFVTEISQIQDWEVVDLGECKL